MNPVADALRTATLYRGLSEEDRARLADVSLTGTNSYRAVKVPQAQLDVALLRATCASF